MEQHENVTWSQKKKHRPITELIILYKYHSITSWENALSIYRSRNQRENGRLRHHSCQESDRKNWDATESKAVMEAWSKETKDIQGCLAMIAGDINTVIECNPLLAPQVYEAALKAVNGESLPKWTPSLEGVFYQKDTETILPTRKC